MLTFRNGTIRRSPLFDHSSIATNRVDKHKMPHNKSCQITAMIEPCPASPRSSSGLSIHSPEYRDRQHHAPLVDTEAVRISLAEAANHAVNWMTRLYHSTPSSHRIMKFQTKDEVADGSLTQASKKYSQLVVRIEKILELGAQDPFLQPQVNSALMVTASRQTVKS